MHYCLVLNFMIELFILFVIYSFFFLMEKVFIMLVLMVSCRAHCVQIRTGNNSIMIYGDWNSGYSLLKAH